MKFKIPWLARLLISAAVLALLFAFVPVREIWDAARKVPVALWFGALGVFLLGHVVAAIKWWRLLAASGQVPFSLAIRAHFSGLTANLCLPGVAGGDLVRAIAVMPQAEKRSGIVSACIADRLVDCFALLVLCGIGIIWTGQMNGLIMQTLLICAGVIMLGSLVAAGGVLFLRRRSGEGKLGQILQAFESLLRRPWLLFSSLLLSVVVQGSFVIVNALFGAVAGTNASGAAWFVAWPLAKLTASLPISLGGLGVREAALVLFMKPFDASADAVIAAGVLWQALLISGGLIGALLFAVPRRSAPVPEKEPTTP